MTAHVYDMSASVFAAVGFAAAVLFSGRSLRLRHLHRVAHEKSTGNLTLRRRMGLLAGRSKDQTYGAFPAETMRGAMWAVWTRRAGQPFNEHLQWAPSERLARRQLHRYLRRAADAVTRR